MTEEAAQPRLKPLWAVQWVGGGIPEDPQLFDNHDNARRYFVETAVANDLKFTEDCSEWWIGNDDDEVRLFGPLYVWTTLAPPTNREWKDGEYVTRPFTAEENEKVEAILAELKRQREEDQLNREIMAEDSTPERPGGCD
jgi:hypothetical protein